jgi:uncharacterized damage-inducible protein DinB
MRKFRSFLFFALFTTPGALLAQGNLVSNTVREVARGSSKNLLAAAEAMPADKYGFKPTPAQMTFGELIIHIQGDNRTTCAAIGGAKPAAEAKLAPTDAKENLVSALQRSLAFCDAALAQVNDAKLGDVVSYYGHSASRVVALIGLVIDWADHYGQQAIYLRLNGVLPPTAR